MEKFKKCITFIKQPLLITVVLMLICGLAFPLALTGISQVLFPNQANGSLITVDGEVVGSKNVGQDFTKDYFMKGRPSAYQYNTYYVDENGKELLNDGSEFGGVSSGSQNMSATNPDLAARVENDIEEFLAANPGVKREDIPTDLLTASGSGLDPHISKASALIQLDAISKASGLTVEELEKIVDDNTTAKVLGIFGEEIVNVLEVNIDIATAMGIINQ